MFTSVSIARKKEKVGSPRLPSTQKNNEVDEKLSVAEMTQEWISAESMKEELLLNIICCPKKAQLIAAKTIVDLKC